MTGEAAVGTVSVGLRFHLRCAFAVNSTIMQVFLTIGKPPAISEAVNLV